MKNITVRNSKLLTALLSATCLCGISSSAYAAGPCTAAVSGTITISTSVDEPCTPAAGQNVEVTSTGSIFRNSSYNTGAAITYSGITADHITNATSGVINGGDQSNNNNTDGIDILSGSTLTTGITNSGTIAGLNAAIYLNNSEIGSIVNNASGVINGGAAGIYSDTSTIDHGIINHGIINEQIRGIVSVNSTIHGGIFNDAGAEIHGGIGKGISLSGGTLTGSLVNNGLIDGSEGGVHIDGAGSLDNLENNGTITSDNSDAVSIDNTTVTGTITNNLNINGASSGINITGGTTVGGLISNTTHGIINAAASGIALDGSTASSGISNSGSITSNGYVGIYASNSTIAGGITNTSTGTIHSDNSFGISINSTNLGTSGAHANILNEGTLEGAEGGIRVENSSVIYGDILNNGTISGIDNSGVGILIDTSTVHGKIDNNGTITGADTGMVVYQSTIDNGIINHAGKAINNASNGIVIITSTIGANGIRNDGTLAGGIAILSSTVTGDVINSSTGTINAGLGYIGIAAVESTINGSIINNHNISGSSDGISIVEGTIITGDVVNTGAIDSARQSGFNLDQSQVNGHIINSGTYSGDDYAVNITAPTAALIFDNSGTLDGDVKIENTTLNVNAGSVITGAITGTAGTVNINTNFGTAADYDVGTINIAIGQTFSPSGSNGFTVADGFNNHGTLAIGQGHTVTVTGPYNQNAAGTLAIQANSTSQYSKLAIVGTGTFAAHTKIDVSATGGATFTNGDVLSSVISTTSIAGTTFDVSDNLAFYDFSAVTAGNNINLLISAVANPIQTSVNAMGNSSAQGAAGSLDAIVASHPEDGDLNTVVGALSGLSTQGASNAASQTTPLTSGGTTDVALDTMGAVDRVIQARQETNSGLSTGEGFLTGQNAWLKPFGSWANQDNQNGFTGYDASTYGIVAGADKLTGEQTRLGGAFAYANSDVNSNNNAAPQNLKVNSYSGIFYGSYSIDSRTDANFQTNIGYNDNTGRRYINFGGLDRTAKSDYGSWNGHLGTGIGRIYDVGTGTTFTPSARIDYSMIRNNSYTEDGAGALNLKVNSQFADELVPAIEGKLNHQIDSKFSATLNGGVGYDVLNSNSSVTSSFVGGGSAFSTRGVDPSPWVLRSGAGLTYKAMGDTDIIARYDREDRGSSFDNQTVSLKIRTQF